jgi:phage terminase large subunit-like protein
MSVVPLLEGDSRALADADREELIDLLQHYRSMSNELIRRAVIERNRIDILAVAVLGYEVQPMHLAMMQFQFQHPDSLQLAFRGSGKTTSCTITKVIHYLLKDPDLRILLASKTINNAKAFLKEIKAHFENNERLAEIFGQYYDPRKVTKWDESEIEVLPRRKRGKEASVTCAGVDGTIVSKHYDVIISDDLVDEENTRTKYMRDKTKTWYYQTLDPCLMPPDPRVLHRGEHHRLGTRYHFDDLWGHLLSNELKDHHQIIPALDEGGNSPWPELYPPEYLEEKKKKSGTIIFNAQFQCDTEAMKGEVFSYDDCQVIDDDKIPKSLQVFQGVDLAASEKATRENAQFAHVTIGVDSADNIYFLDYFLGYIGFPKQIKRALELYDQFDPIRVGVESNAYQKVFVQEMKDRDVDARFVPIHTDKDKMTRALKLTPLFEAKRVFFRRNMETLIDQFVLFPGYKLRDGIDAFDLAIKARRRKRKRKHRTEEPGLL